MFLRFTKKHWQPRFRWSWRHAFLVPVGDHSSDNKQKKWIKEKKITINIKDLHIYGSKIINSNLQPVRLVASSFTMRWPQECFSPMEINLIHQMTLNSIPRTKYYELIQWWSWKSVWIEMMLHNCTAINVACILLWGEVAGLIASTIPSMRLSSAGLIANHIYSKYVSSCTQELQDGRKKNFLGVQRISCEERG